MIQFEIFKSELPSTSQQKVQKPKCFSSALEMGSMCKSLSSIYPHAASSSMKQPLIGLIQKGLDFGLELKDDCWWT